MMCPLISPARGAARRFISALMSEWPVFHMRGTPPAEAMPSNSTWLHFTSPMIVAPGARFNRSRARNSRIWSPHRMRLGVHHAETVAVAVEGDAEIAVLGAHRGLELLQVLRHGRVGVVIGKVAVDALIQQNV